MKKIYSILLLFFTLIGFAQIPANDNCATATNITQLDNFCSNPGQYTNVGATPSGFGPPTCWTAASYNNEVWFQFTAIATDVVISVYGNENGNGTLVSPQIAIFSGTCTLTSELGCKNALPGENYVTIYEGGLTAGLTYLIRIDAAGTNTGTFQFCINNYTPVVAPGQDCSSATFLCNTNTINTPFLSGAGLEQDAEAIACINTESNAVWYTWTCGTAGTLTFDLIPSNPSTDLDFVVFEFAGAICGPKTTVKCNPSGCINPPNGATGLSDSSTATTSALGCDVPALSPTYLSPLNMVAGRNYGLLINNFSSAGEGFTLSFGGTGTFAGPVANFTATPFSGTCVGSPITITDSSVGAASYSWNFGSGASPATASTAGPHSVTYSTAGIKTITLSIIGSTGCTVVSSQTITITQPVVTATAVTPSFCVGQSTVLNGGITVTTLASPVTFSKTVNTAIPNNNPTGISSTINTMGIFPTNISNSTIASVCIDIQHARDQDLDISLTSPCGVTIDLSSDNGANLRNYTNTCFTSAAGTAITAGTAPFSGSFTPEQSFALMNGACNPNGVWTLRVVDDMGGAASIGTFSNWSISFNTQNSYTYAWSPTTDMTGSTTLNPTVTPTATTTYTLTATDALGCTAASSVPVTVTPPVTPIFTTPAPICSGGTAPTLPTNSNDTPPISGTWSGPVSNTTTGNYTFTPNPGQCANTAMITVTVNSGPTAIATTIVNASCGASTGSVTLGAVTGGTPGYLYSFNGGGFGPTLSYTGLAPGTYPIVVQDANGCTYTTSATIVNIPGPTNIATTIVSATCGNPTGSVTLGAVTGGTAPFTYQFNGTGGYTAVTNYTGLSAGAYTIDVKDANGCIYNTSVTVNNIPGPTNIATTVVDAACGTPNGSITLGSVTGGTSPYTYQFNGTGGFTGTTSYTGLLAGSYTVEVKDANGCIFLTNISVSNSSGPTSIATTVVNATCGLSNGSITLGTVTGGTGPYQYEFNNTGGYTAVTNYPGLPAGGYPVNVKDANGCIYSTTVTITDAPGVTAVASTIVNATCGFSNGSVTLGTVTGGTPAYEYEFNGGGYGTATVFSGLAAGNYTINVRDINGCIFTTSVTVNDLPGPTAIASTIVDETCGNANGSVTFGAVTGGTGPYTHNFNNTGYPGVATYSGLTAGSYPLEVQDANGCTFTTTIVIANSPGITAIASTVVDAVCGTPNGSITLGTVTGGTAPYQYQFNNTGGYTSTTNYPGLPAGSYPVDVKDVNGCIFSTSIIILNSGGPTAIATTIVNATCGTPSGSVTLGTVTGGTSPYTYQFNNTGGYTGVTSYNSLAPGTYTIDVKDANGCIYSTSITITNSGGPTAIATTLIDPTCGGMNGSVSIGGTTGGVAPYQYNFNNTGYPGSTNYTGLAAGTYPLEVKDANGCTFMTNVTLTDLPGPTAIVTTIVNENCGSANGSVTLGSVTGGTAPYQYQFNNTGGYTSVVSYTGLAAGTYAIDVQDANGCIYSTTIAITNNPGPTAIAFTVVDAACGASDGSITLGTVTGGTAGYTYQFNGTGGYTAATSYPGLPAGSYSLDVKDANGCIFSTVIPVSNAGGPTAVATTQTNATCGNPNGSINIGSVTGGTGPYTYQFNNTGGYTSITSYTGLAAGTYGIDVKDASGCIFSTTVVITDTAGPTAIATPIVNSTCGAANGSVALGAVTGGTGPYTYQFNGTGGYTTATNYPGLSAGTYTIDVQDANGCIYSTSVTLTTTAAPTVMIDYPNSPFCVSTVVGQSVTITGSGTYTGGTYSATPAGLSINASTGDITPNTSTPGTYTVTYTIPASGGCPAITDTTSVTINPEVAPTITCGPPTTTSVQFNWAAVVGATAYDVSYVITGQSPVTVGSITATTYDVTGLTPGSVVTITVTPTNPSGGCFKAASLACTASACTPASADISYGTPFCDNDTAPKPVTITGSGTYTGGTYSAAPAGLIINAATGAITPSGSTPANYTITYLLTGTAGCPDVSDTTTITITPMPTANIVYASSSYCTSNTFPQGVSLTGTGAYTGGTYSAAPAGLSINASTGAITPSTSTAGNYTISYSPPPAGGCTPAAVTTTVTITAMPTANISYATPFCISTATPQSVTITGTGAYTGGTYSAPGGLSINVNTGAITPNTSIAGTYLVTYTIPASAGCLATTTTTNVTINGLPVAIATPSTQAICSGNTTSIAISSPTPGTTFAWTVVQSGGAAGASNGTGSNIAQTLTTGTTAGTVVYTITPTANGCAGAPVDVTITVNASPTATATPAVSAICSGQSTGITLTSTLAGTTYSWIANQSGGASGASNGTGNVISQVLTTGTAIGTVIYTITPTANGCVGMPITATVTVTPPPTAIATPDTDTICANQTTNIALSSSVPGTTFSWNVVQTNVSGAGSGTGNVIAQTLQTVIPSSAGEAVYVITPSTNGCPGIPITVRVTVNPNPVLTANPTQDVICSGETTAISLSSNVPGTIFNWTVNQTNLTGTSAGTGNLIAQTLSTVTSADGTAVYTITPIANGCPGNSFDVTVTVRPRPEVFGAPNTTICSGESSNITLAPSPGATTTTFAWTVSQIGVTGATAGSGSFIDQILETTGTSAGTVTYTVTPTANGCEGTPIDLTITVNPLPIPVLEDGIICVDAAGNSFLNYTLDTGLSNAGYDFVWYFNNSTTPISGASNATYSASEEGVYTVVVTNTATSCVSDATLATASATVTPSYPGAIASLSASPAFTNNATITVTMNPPANPNYLYSLDDGPLQESNIFSGVSPGDHTVHVTDLNGCTNSTQTVSIIGYPHYFTPNGDNVNDNWNIIGLTDAKIYIFDRYGKLIKQISPNGEGWDGTYNGELLPSTDYWFNVEYIELGQGKIFNSHFSLKR